jgi:NAD(P)-dependent dehydrogenase (short-subunit alcohol dehydrogenase family)
VADTKKVALVTGGGTGVGKASALALARAGFTLVLAGRKPDPIDAVARKIIAGGGEAIAVPTDIGDPRSVTSLFTKTKTAYGRLDVLFNNAGTGAPGVSLEEITFEQWQTIVAANLTGAFLCTQQAFRMMKEQTPHGGRIINNGSISAHAPRLYSAPYTATKHAITGLTKSTSLDGRAFNIACGQIDIGNAATDMTARMPEGALQADGRKMPEPRIDADLVANGVVYMATLPLDANVLFMTVMATAMPFVGRG